MSKRGTSPNESPKKPFPKEVEINEDTLQASPIINKQEKIHSLAKVIKKNQEAIQILKLELSDKDRIIKEIMDKL
jgi:hypothetical protein